MERALPLSPAVRNLPDARTVSVVRSCCPVVSTIPQTEVVPATALQGVSMVFISEESCVSLLEAIGFCAVGSDIVDG